MRNSIKGFCRKCSSINSICSSNNNSRQPQQKRRHNNRHPQHKRRRNSRHPHQRRSCNSRHPQQRRRRSKVHPQAKGRRNNMHPQQDRIHSKEQPQAKGSAGHPYGITQLLQEHITQHERFFEEFRAINHDTKIHEQTVRQQHHEAMMQMMQQQHEEQMQLMRQQHEANTAVFKFIANCADWGLGSIKGKDKGKGKGKDD